MMNVSSLENESPSLMNQVWHSLVRKQLLTRKRQEFPSAAFSPVFGASSARSGVYHFLADPASILLLPVVRSPQSKQKHTKAIKS